MQLAESTDNELAKKILKDIADEKRTHADEFMKRARTLGIFITLCARYLP
jgi:rubrerythrin